MDGKFRVDQGVIAGCSGGTYQNIVRAAQILDGRAIGSGEFWLSVYPTSQPVNLELTRRGYIASLMAAGALSAPASAAPASRGRRARQRGFLHPSLHP